MENLYNAKFLIIAFFSKYNTQGGARNFPTGADSSDEGTTIWFSGYYKCQKSPKKSPFTF